MLHEELEAPPAAEPERDSREPQHQRPLGQLRRHLAAHPILASAAGLIMFSVALVMWADTRPGFDPYGWLVWGRQTLHWNLNTNGAPSWKPLPYIFTLPYSLTGHYALRLWMFTAATASLAGVVFAARIALRLTGAPPGRRWPAWVAAAAAGAGILAINDYAHYILSSQSDPVIVSCCLGALDAHLCGRRRTAFWLGVLACLGRPEAWPFLGLYGLWLYRSDPRTRVMVAAGFLAIAALWFGIPAITADSPFVAGNLALHSDRAIHGNKIIGTLSRFRHLEFWPFELAALAAFAYAVRIRDRLLTAVGLIAAGWVVVEAAFALHGWPAIPRYMFEAAGFMVVLAATGVGRLLLADPSSIRLGGRTMPRWTAAAVAIVLAGVLVPDAVSRLSHERKDLYRERNRTRQITRLGPLVARLGGLSAIERCGQPATEIEHQSQLAWTLGVNVGDVGYFPTAKRHRRKRTQVVLRGAYHGWSARPIHVTPGRRSACSRMRGFTAVS